MLSITNAKLIQLYNANKSLLMELHIRIYHECEGRIEKTFCPEDRCLASGGWPSDDKR